MEMDGQVSREVETVINWTCAKLWIDYNYRNIVIDLRNLCEMSELIFLDTFS
jgi:hypothetical protein